MILGIGAILLLVILVYAIVTVRSQANHLLDVTRREAELIAAVAERAIARAMTEGKSEEVQAILEQIGEVPHLGGIRIVGPNGAILRSNRPEEAGQILAQRDRPLDGKLRESVWDYRERTVGIFRPIINGSACHACHPQDRTTLAFLNVQLPFPSIRSQMAHEWTFMALPAVLALIAAGGLIAIYFTLVVGRRIDAISQTMSRVEAGDLTAEVPENERDELGRLGKSFNAMVARLADAQRQLEDRHAEEIRRAEHLASLGKMAAGIAHEVNNPLAGMQNCVRTLLKGVRGDAQRGQYLEMLQEGLGRIGRIVGQLLGFAREAKPELTRTHLTPLVRRCLALLEHELAARKISCSLSAGSELPVLLADPHQLEQVFLNILMNALETMPSGGSLTIAAGLGKRDGAPFVEVSVTDTGVGIPPETLPRVFDPFFTTKEVGKGTGLGLSVSYGIVRAHGGFIDVQSEVGKGSTFTVALPVGREARSDASPDPAGRR
ncbi:MAG: sensor histidine kinase [Candidatus Methylomirabilales bacterium]